MNQAVIERLRGELAGLREQGLYKSERVLTGPNVDSFNQALSSGQISVRSIRISP